MVSLEVPAAFPERLRLVSAELEPEVVPLPLPEPTAPPPALPDPVLPEVAPVPVVSGVLLTSELLG